MALGPDSRHPVVELLGALELTTRDPGTPSFVANVDVKRDQSRVCPVTMFPAGP